MRVTILIIVLLTSGFAQAQPAIHGPDAPAVDLQFSNGAFHFALSNPMLSNNYMESYIEIEPSLGASGAPIPYFRFQGYQVFQVRDTTVGLQWLWDASVSRIVNQSDLADSVTSLANFSYDSATAMCVGLQQVIASNSGTQMQFDVTDDEFAPGGGFVENQEYCFIAIAYAHNPYFADPNCPNGMPYLRGRRSGSGGIRINCARATESSSISELMTSQRLIVSPNPASQTATIEVLGFEAAEITVYNMLGQTVYTSKIIGSQVLNIRDLATGHYIVRVQGGAGNSKVEKLIVY